MTKHGQKHSNHKSSNGSAGQKSTKTAEMRSRSKLDFFANHGLQVILLLSVVIFLAGFLSSAYWDEIVRGTAFIVATVKRLSQPTARTSIVHLLEESGLPQERRKQKGEVPRTDPNSASLHKKFSLDFKQVQRIRLRNMNKYSFNYSVYGIDRRANLSLQEFRDVYDGKW